ncbi:MAG TPA: hypothetical protein VLB80_04565 [Candidatus Babeliales bacterium]|nr:hypothetical protein [Candidatus Babeliales bacterium]
MNIFRTISRVLVVAMIVCAGNAVAGENGNNWGSKIKDMGKGACKGAGETLDNYKVQLAAYYYMDKMVPNKKKHFARAGIRTYARYLDALSKKCKKIKIDDKETVCSVHSHQREMASFIVDLAMCEIGDKLNEAGYGIDYVVEKCDRLPEGKVRNAVNYTVRNVAETVTEPEVRTFAAMYVLTNLIIPMFTVKK